MRNVTASDRPARTCGLRKTGLALCALALMACLVPVPVEAASIGRTLHRAPDTTSQAPATCRPKWPYIVLTCVA